MASILELEIQQHLSQYLEGNIPLHEFEDWFIPILWDLAESTDETTRELSGRIQNLIAEAALGDRSAESLRNELALAVRTLSTCP